tara:strand:- start:1307 stop:1948 length:642 start_codon:yes stop_codon:yes gene_type:complete
MIKPIEKEFQGNFGRYTITLEDQYEVRKYRIALLICGISFVFGLSQWLLISPSLSYIWLFIMAISLGLALKWIHIYITLLHRILQLFWAIGLIGLILLSMIIGPQQMLTEIAIKPIFLFAIGPLFASLAGLGFKEFFCFQRIEAIGLTLILPIALISHLLSILSPAFVMGLLYFSAVLLLIMAIRKFGMEAASDIGDKSVFEYLKNQRLKTNN